ncbi:conserved hypothetical protein [Paecilomyces variotii No. 5]|uniref:LYR family protein n=1 Tax=Byssochlamys spectabilis (strain No. 5 / NBRC 109023) TaxID=1356009 RepID=V5FUD7_BYSSN|nr:conserved hypothetical protein [Paecilomyces variotii No. 5]
MAPTFRSSRSGRQFIDNSAASRSRTIDHDVFEGLPVRRWTRQPHNVSQAEKMDEPDSGIGGAAGGQPLPELPMPKDSHLLTPSSRALLRAARAGCIYIRQVTKDADGEQKETTDIDETATVVPRTERSFTTKKWGAVPRHMEPPEVEFLAKRRPGLPSLYGGSALNTLGGTGVTPAPPMRKTKFKKVDPATGNVSIYEAWIPEGHTLEGEIKETGEVVPEQPDATVTKEAPAPGTVVEGVGVVNAEGVVVADANAAPKRRPPPPKRKAKGVGKGRKKKVMFAPGEGGDAGAVHAAGTDGAAANHMSLDGTADEPMEGSEEEDGEEGEESDEDAESAAATKSPSAAPQEADATPATEANVPPPTESNAEAEPSASTTANEEDTAKEQPAQQDKQLSLPVPSDEKPADVEMQLGEPESEEVSTELPPTEQPASETPAPAPPVAEPAEPQPAESEPMEGISQEQPTSASEEPQEAKPEPQPDEMTGVEHTGLAEDTAAPAEPETEPKPEIEKTEEAKPESTTEAAAPQEAEATASASTEPTAAIEASAEAEKPEEPAAEPAPAPSNEGEVDLLGTLEASLGDKPSEQQAQEQPDRPAPSSSSPKPEPSEPAPEPSAPEPAEPEPEPVAAEPSIPTGAPSEPAPDTAPATEEKKDTEE